MRNLVLLLTAALFGPGLLSGCTGPAGPASLSQTRAGPAADAPQYKVGDRWVYRVRDGFRIPIVWEETHTVTSIGADGITVAVAMRGPQVNGDRVEKWPAAGRVSQGVLLDIETRRFREPLLRYRFPLESGSTWNQFVDNFNELSMREGRINRHVRVGGHEQVTTPAGTFDAIRLNIVMRLDDEEFWRWPTDGTHTVWYAPAAKASVREVKRADYLEKGGGTSVGRLRTQNTLVELMSFTPGA